MDFSRILAEVSPKVPLNELRQSCVVVFEPFLICSLLQELTLQLDGACSAFSLSGFVKLMLIYEAWLVLGRHRTC